MNNKNTTQAPKGIKRLVIAGGGTAGWITAAVLAKAVGKTIDITLVESDAIPTVGVGEATIPPLLTLHKILEIDEAEVVAEVNGTFKLGIMFENWRHKDHSYVHSFGRAGKDCWACGFQHFWLAGKKQGIDVEYGDYCLEHYAARKNKFAVLPNGEMNYAYHMDAGRYAKFLRKYCEKLGVKRQEGTIKDVEVSAHSGNIDSLLLASGERVEGDLFVDCTGFRGLLINEALHTGYQDWSHWLPCDRAIPVQTESQSELTPYTRSIAHESGWQWRIPLQNRVGNGHVYCSKYISDDEATSVLLNNIEGKPITDPRVIKFRTGTRTQHWNKNCIAIGLSSGFLEPLESTSIHLIQKSAIRLAHLFPSNGLSRADIDEFNRQTKSDVEQIRDFVILHYKVTERDDSRFWRYCKNMDVPESLAHKISLFNETGVIIKEPGELFAEESWMQVMLGQGLMPKTHHPIVDAMSKEELSKFLLMIRSSIAKKTDTLPTHSEFIDYYCKAKM